MNSRIRKGGYAKTAGVVLGIVLLLAAAYPFSPAYQQARSLKLARQHADEMNRILRTDERFKGIRCGGYTGSGGLFWITGTVTSKEDFVALQKRIQVSKPPVETKWSVMVLDLGQ